jgi:hypothetical protein
VDVAAERLARWVEGFEHRHGRARATLPSGDAVLLRAQDGATATLRVPFPPLVTTVDGDHLVAALRDHVGRPRRCAAVLVRRGGYACAAVAGQQILGSKVGTRHVQSRTAAGGWSQQRYARRRNNQATALVGVVVEAAMRILAPHRPFELLVTGGDAALVARVLDDARLGFVAALPRGPHLAVADPRAVTVRNLPAMLSAVTVEVRDP